MSATYESLSTVVYPFATNMNPNMNPSWLNIIYLRYLPGQVTFPFVSGKIHPMIAGDPRTRSSWQSIDSFSIALHVDINLSIQSAKRLRDMTVGSHMVLIFHSAQKLIEMAPATGKSVSIIATNLLVSPIGAFSRHDYAAATDRIGRSSCRTRCGSRRAVRPLQVYVY